jgi:hypothetical protein
VKGVRGGAKDIEQCDGDGDSGGGEGGMEMTTVWRTTTRFWRRTTVGSWKSIKPKTILLRFRIPPGLYRQYWYCVLVK